MKRLINFLIVISMSFSFASLLQANETNFKEGIETASVQEEDNYTSTMSSSKSLSLSEDDEFVNNDNIPTKSINEDLIMNNNGRTIPLFYKELSNTILSKFDVLSALTPDNYREMITPKDSTSFGRYANTFYGDDSANSNFNIGLKASNFLLDTIFGGLTDNILTLNLANNNSNSSDINAMKIQAQPLSWLKLKVIFDLKATNQTRTNLLEVEFNPTSNTALILRNRDNSTENQTGIEFRLNF